MRLSRRHLLFVVSAVVMAAVVTVASYATIVPTNANVAGSSCSQCRSQGLVTALAAVALVDPTETPTATTLTATTTTLTSTTTTVVIPAPPTSATTTTTTTTTTPPPPFPSSNVSYANGAIISFGGTHYVFAGGRAFGIASPTVLAAVQKVDPAKILTAPAGASAPSSTTPRSGVLVFTKPVNGNPTIYVVGTDGELHGFATPKQFGTDGYNGKYVVTVPTLGGLKVGSTAGTALTALVTRADAAIVNSSGTFYTFAGGRAFGIPTPAELTRIRAANTATNLSGTVTPAEKDAAVASGVLLSVTPPVYVTYHGYAYPFRTMTQLMNTGYGGTAGIPVPHTGGLPVVLP